MEDTLPQAMKSATEKEKDTTTTRKFGDLPLSLEENLNNTANMLKSIKTKDQRTFSSSMLLTMEFLMLNSMRSLLISEFKNWQNALEILQKNTENLSLKIQIYLKENSWTNFTKKELKREKTRNAGGVEEDLTLIKKINQKPNKKKRKRNHLKERKEYQRRKRKVTPRRKDQAHHLKNQNQWMLLKQSNKKELF